MHVAQLNIGRALYPLDDPRMAGFMNALAAINAIADRCAGLRLAHAGRKRRRRTDIKYTDDPQQIANMSVWETAEALEHFVWNTAHKRIYSAEARVVREAGAGDLRDVARRRRPHSDAGGSA